MNKYFLVLLIFLAGCNDNSTKVEENVTFLNLEISGETKVKEGNLGSIKIHGTTSSTYEVNWSQQSGTKTYLINRTGNLLTFRTPNVIKDDELEFTAEIKSKDGLVKSLSWKVKVSNTPVKKINQTVYPNVFSSPNIAKHSGKTFDSSGIPLYINNGNEYYYPVLNAAYTYDLYNNYFKLKDEGVLQRFLTNATWLRDNCVYTPYGFCSYRSYFPISVYKLTNDWTSAMAQGQAITSLIAAHQITGDESYGQVAYDAIAAYLYPLSEKGLKSDFNGSSWYEEYGSEEMPAHVLNGFLFSLSGVYDFMQIYGETFAQEVFDTGVDSIVKNIPLYDFNFTSRYDYSPLNQLASTNKQPDGYHELHIFQLGWLFNVSQNQKLKEYAHLFLKQDMGGIQSVYKFSTSSKTILNVSASNTINSETFGTGWLTDANWTWLRNWSSNIFPVDLTLTVNSDILDAGILEKLVLTSVTQSDFPTSMSLYEINEDGNKVLLKSNFSLNNVDFVAHEYDINGYKSYTVVMELNVSITSNQLLLQIDGTDSGIVRLRELDLHYPRHELLEDILNYYPMPYINSSKK